MARPAPIILAFLLNCCEIFIFRNAFSVSYAPQTAILARNIFIIGNYFLLLSLKLYPKSFRRTHWIPRSFTEFIVGVYLLETFLCDFWFPLEYFTHCTYQKLITLMRKKTPSTGSVCVILCNLVKILSNKKIPEAISIILSAFISLILIHGTRTINFSILRQCGVKDFVLHIKDQIVKGIKRFITTVLGLKQNSCSRGSSRSCSRGSSFSCN